MGDNKNLKGLVPVKPGDTGEAHDGLLRLEELADALNLPDVAAVSNVKWRLLEYHKKNKNADEYEKFRNMVEGWFVKFGRVKFFKSLHYAEFQSLLQEMPHKKGRYGGEESETKRAPIKNTKTTIPVERQALSGKSVGGVLDFEEDQQDDEGNTELVKTAVQILESLVGQRAKDLQVTGTEPEYWKDFYKIQAALVIQIKLGRNDIVRKYVKATQYLAEVVEKYLSKNI